MKISEEDGFNFESKDFELKIEQAISREASPTGLMNEKHKPKLQGKQLQ